MAAEVALLLRYQQQDNRQRQWLNAVSEYVGFHTDASVSGVESSEALVRKPNLLAHLAHAFLETYDAEDVCVHGPTQTLTSRTEALSAIAARVDAERPIAIETRSDTTGTLRVIALRVEMAGFYLVVGALWRETSHGISRGASASNIAQHEAALMTLAGVCALHLRRSVRRRGKSGRHASCAYGRYPLEAPSCYASSLQGIGLP